MKLFDSNDTNANAALFIVACAVGLMLFAVSAAVALPVLAIVGIVKGIHWYKTRPPPSRKQA